MSCALCCVVSLMVTSLTLCRGVGVVHYCMFSDNYMVRRAATEALCNMAGDEKLLVVCNAIFVSLNVTCC